MTSILKIDEISTSSPNIRLKLNGMPQGYVYSTSQVSSNVRTAVGTAVEGILFSGNFIKTRDDSFILATSTVFGDGYFSGNCGVGMRLGGIYWDHGSAYQYDGSWSSTAQTTIIVGTGYWTIPLPAGTYNMGFGWRTADGNANNRPFNNLNPNNQVSGEGRNQQMESRIIIYEIAG